MLLEPKAIKIEYNFITSRENLKNYLKWIEYNPKH